MKLHGLLVGAILCVIPAFGHHNIAAEFDVSKTVKMSGTISKVQFLNPHVTFSLDVKNADGTVTQWKIETAGPNAMMRVGITKAMLATGTTIAVEAYPAKDGSPKADGRTLILASGQELRAGPWEHDLWNPLRDPTSNWCDEAKPRPDDCIRVIAPAK